MDGWELSKPMQTRNGVHETATSVCAAADDNNRPYEYYVYGEKEVSSQSFYGVFGYGHTPEEAMQDAVLAASFFLERK